MAQNPKRPVAPHVQAAIAAAAQPKKAETAGGTRPLAAHVQAVISAAAQPKVREAVRGARPLAAHVQRSIAGSLQAYAPGNPSTTLQPASSQSTQITLDIDGTVVAGKSSTQHCSHAEMNALHKFIMNNHKGDLEAAYSAIQDAGVKTVSCTAKPVCVACAAVLRDLGFKAADPETEFSGEQSGGIEWGLSMAVKAFIEYVHEDVGAMKSVGHYLALGKK